jgi:hypothetical protein
VDLNNIGRILGEYAGKEWQGTEIQRIMAYTMDRFNGSLPTLPKVLEEYISAMVSRRDIALDGQFYRVRRECFAIMAILLYYAGVREGQVQELFRE